MSWLDEGFIAVLTATFLCGSDGLLQSEADPTVVMEHDRMDGAALVDDLVEPLLGLSRTVLEAAWFWCVGGAPVDFVLGYTDPPASPNGVVTLRLRFADAKHTNTVLVLGPQSTLFL